MKAASASIRLYEEKSGKLVIAAGYSADNKHAEFKAALGTDSAEGKVFISSCDLTEDNPASGPAENALSYTGIPITSSGIKLGVFSMYFSGRKKFSSQEMDALSVNNPAPGAQGVRTTRALVDKEA